MAGHSAALNQKWAAENEARRCAAGLKRDYGDYEPVGECWKRQTAKAAVFPTKGTISTTLLRWRKADGTVVDWTMGRGDDVLLAPTWALARAATQPRT